MHILLVTTYFEPDSGAAAVRLSRLAHLLQKRGHQITVLTTLPHFPQGRIASRYANSWTVEQHDAGLHIIRTWLWATASPRISRKLLSQLSFMVTASLQGIRLPRPDVMLIEAQPVFTSLAGVLLSRRFNVPYVLNVSDLWPDHLLSVGALKADNPVYRMARQLVDLTYRRAAAITALSPLWAEKITQYVYGQTPVHIIYNGVDLQRFHHDQRGHAFRERYDLGDKKLVSFMGTFATQYDFATMLSVAQHFASHSDVQFVLVGQGSQSGYVRQQITRIPNVRWIPWVDFAEMPQAWAASDVTFWALRPQELYRGTIPAKLYEAMASGTPIVAATEDVAARIIRESGGGFATDFGDVTALTTALGRLLSDAELRKKVGQAGRSYAEQHFASSQIMQAYESVLMEAAGK